MEIIGALALTIVAAIVVFVTIGVPYIGLGFGGPTVTNVVGMIIGTALAAATIFGWWVFVGSEINVSFG